MVLENILSNNTYLNIIISTGAILLISYLNKHIKGYHSLAKLKNFLIVIGIYGLMYFFINGGTDLTNSWFKLLFLINTITSLFLIFILDNTTFLEKKTNLGMGISLFALLTTAQITLTIKGIISLQA